ncbi:hypothetical protein B0H14DRAFT_3448178 [Mycena olivaceomarginata]|nr:hypothetical protein B0H14DRAFT_3448178 [Mycena olivaceomarginata]
MFEMSEVKVGGMTHRLKSISRMIVALTAGVTNVRLVVLAVAVYAGSGVAEASASGSVAGGHCPKDWTAAEAVIPAPAPPSATR